MKILLPLYIVAVVLLFASWTMGADTMTLRSSYLGDGRFQYELTLSDEPWVKEYYQVGIDAFTNASYVIPVSGFSNDADRAYWYVPLRMQDGSPTPVAYPHTFIFEAGSTATSYRLGKVTVFYAFSPPDQLISFFFPSSIAGYGIIDALVPCLPSETNSSPTTFMSSIPFHPDVTLKGLVMMSNRVHGLSFDFPGASTVIVQGSSDFHNWTNISYALGNQGTTTWTSSVPIDSCGPFYRVLLSSTIQRPDLIGKSIAPTTVTNPPTLQDKAVPQFWIFRSQQSKNGKNQTFNE